MRPSAQVDRGEDDKTHMSSKVLPCHLSFAQLSNVNLRAIVCAVSGLCTGKLRRRGRGDAHVGLDLAQAAVFEVVRLWRGECEGARRWRDVLA